MRVKKDDLEGTHERVVVYNGGPNSQGIALGEKREMMRLKLSGRN